MLTTCAVVHWRPWYQRYKAETQQLAKASHYKVSMHTDSYKNSLLNIIRAKAYAYTSNTAVNIRNMNFSPLPWLVQVYH